MVYNVQDQPHRPVSQIWQLITYSLLKVFNLKDHTGNNKGFNFYLFIFYLEFFKKKLWFIGDMNLEKVQKF